MAAPIAPGRYGPDGLGGEHRLSTSERVYSGLLRAYPPEFRSRYRDEMVVLFGDQLRDARASGGVAGVSAIWTRTLLDLAKSAVGEHLRRDRAMAHSLTTFEPTRSMRLLGLFGALGAALLLWAFVSVNPFEDPALNFVRLISFSLAGAAIALAFYPRQAIVAPTLALLTTAAVVIGGVWYATWTVLSTGVDRPFLGEFGLVNLFANIALWVTPAAWALGALHTGAAWRGMSRMPALATKVGLWSLVGSIVGWLGDDRLGLVDSLWAEMWVAVALTGVVLNGVGWLTLGAVLLFGGTRSQAGRPGPSR